MKNNLLRSLAGAFASLLLLTIISISPAFGQNAGESPTPSPTPFEFKYKKEKKFSKEERDELKAKIGEVFEFITDASETITPTNANSKKRLDAAKSKLALITDDDLDTLRESLDPAVIDQELTGAKEKLEKVKPTMAGIWGQLASGAYETGDGKRNGRISSSNLALPGIEGPDALCDALIGAGYAREEVVLAAKAALLVTKIINIASDRGCNQVVVAGVVVLGNGGVGGGNPSLACIVSDGLLFAAEQLLEKINSCNVDFTDRTVAAAFARMGTVHADLESSVANDNGNRKMIIDNSDVNKNSVIANSDANKGLITANSNANRVAVITEIGAGTLVVTGAVSDGTAALIAAGTANKNTVVANDNANKKDIVANDDANRTVIMDFAKANKDFLLRTQIEADLSSTDGAAFVAIYLTPASVCAPVLNDKGEAVTGAAQCGYLDFARAIVAQTVNNIGGTNKTQANSFLAAGDAQAAAKNYRMAYHNYRLAYKMAMGVSSK